MSQIPVFLINREAATHRLTAMQRQLCSLDITFERFPAVEGADLTPEFIAKLAPERTWIGKRRPSPGEVGCFLSHIRVLELMRDRGYGRICVLEDDVRLAPDFSDYLKDDLAWPSGADVLKLEIAFPKPRLRVVPLGKLGQRELVFIPTGGEPGSAAYIVTAQGGTKLLADFRVMIDVYDGQAFHYWRNPICIYHVIPLPAVQALASEMERPTRGPRFKKRRIIRWKKKIVNEGRIAYISMCRLAYMLKQFGVWRTLTSKYILVMRKSGS
jgi:glycosyl transferase, family 25